MLATRSAAAPIALIRDIGIDVVQIDDPHLCLFVDPDVRRGYDDPDRAADFTVDMVNAVVDGFDGVKFAVHLCRRAGARVRGEKHHAGTYGPILAQLNRLKVQHLTLEFTAAGADDLESLGRLREDVLCIERVLRIGDEFKVFSRFYVDPGRLPAFAKLPARKLSGENFKEIIWRESQQPIGRISQLLSSATLPTAVCKAIGVKPGTRGELLEASAYAGRDSPIYYQELYIPPNRRRLHLPNDGKDPGIGSEA